MTRRPSRLELLLLLMALGLGVAQRVEGVTERAFFGDEHHTLLLHRPASPPVELEEAGYGEILTTFDMTGSHVVLPLLQRVALDVVGPGPGSYRLPALLPGILMLLLCYPLLRSFLGAGPALLGTIALALNPMHVFYSHFARSYALVMFTSVFLAYCVLQGLRSLRSCSSNEEASFLQRRGWWIATFCLAWFTPYAHLSTAGYVFALGVVAIVLARWEGGAWRSSAAPFVAFAGAALVCGLLYLPLYEQVLKYMNVQQIKARPETIVGIPILLYGGGIMTIAGLLALPFAGVLLWRRERAAFVIAMTTLIGPLFALLATRPHGMEYAYARYLLCSVPFLLGFLALAFLALIRRFVANQERAGVVAALVGSVLLFAAYWSGPLGPDNPRGPFGNCYLAMHALPAFDEPYPHIPEVYAEIAADDDAQRIIEFPPIWTRAALAYRNYALFHGKEVTIGYDAPMPGGMRGGPYARLSEIDVSDGDYLVLHRDPVPEVRRYFRWVYDEAVPRHRSFGDDGFLERHKSTFVSNLPKKEVLGRTAAALRNLYGPAWRKSDELLVWKIVD